MSWSFKIGRVFGIPIFIHWTFLILIAYLVYGHSARGDDLSATAEGVGFVLAIFGCVVLHELGHALAARRYGVPTSDITLLPIGGVARLQRIPERPVEELVVALAGPAVNLVIAVGLLLSGVTVPVDSDPQTFLITGPFLSRLMFVNVFLLLFNLLPAFPMDGGRVLRALLAMAMPYAKATRVAASVGQFMAILFGFLGLSGNPFLLLIALFVWIGAEAEARQVEERMVLKDLPIREAMLTDFQTLHPDDTLGRAADLLLAGSQQDFPVLVDGRPQGVLTRSALLSGLASGGRDARVSQTALAELKTIGAGDQLVPAVARLREGGEPCMIVLDDDGEPIGLLNLENIGEFLMVRTALAEVRKASTSAFSGIGDDSRSVAG